MKMHSKRLLILMAALLLINASFAAFFTDNHRTSDGGSKEFSLKNLKRFPNTYSAQSFNLSTFKFNGSRDVYQVKTANSIQGQSIIRLQSGNTTYVYPYKYTVKVPRFKTPVKN